MATLPVMRALQATAGATVRGELGGEQNGEYADVAAPGVRLGPALLTRRDQKPSTHFTQVPRKQAGPLPESLNLKPDI